MHPSDDRAPQAPDDEAVARAQAGEEVAFIALYQWLQPRLLRYLTALVGPAAEDVAAEAWAQACRDLSRFAGGRDAFRAWVTRIARNRALDHLRAQQRTPAAPMPAWELPERCSRAADEVAEERAATRRAIALIASLPRDQAEAVLLRAVVGLDAASAGEVLGKRPGAVRTSAHRGLRTLAAWLDIQPRPGDRRTERCDVPAGPDA